MQSYGLQPETRASRKGKARGVKEVEIVAALGQMDNVLAVQGVVGDHAVHRLPDSQIIRIVEEGGGSARLGHLLELPAFLPGIRPGTVIGRIANGVVGNGGAVVGGHLVLPVGISIGVCKSSFRPNNILFVVNIH